MRAWSKMAEWNWVSFGLGVLAGFIMFTASGRSLVESTATLAESGTRKLSKKIKERAEANKFDWQF